MSTVSVKNFTRLSPRALAGVPFSAIAASRLRDWDISLVLVGEQRARSINARLRGKTYAPNVLSYEVGPKSGEIILCPQVARAEAASYGHTFSEHLLYLFIHGILHLEGRQHGATMTRWEQRLFATFAKRSAYGTTHRRRH